jgi:hypothetical protein
VANHKTLDVRTVTVMSSQPMVRPDGRVAIRLDTGELGSIAFEVDQRAIEGLLQAIASVETQLRQKAGNA